MHALSTTKERFDEMNLTERERELVTAVFKEMFRLWKLYRAMTRQFRIKEALTWHAAQDKALDFVYDNNIAPMLKEEWEI